MHIGMKIRFVQGEHLVLAYEPVGTGSYLILAFNPEIDVTSFIICTVRLIDIDMNVGHTEWTLGQYVNDLEFAVETFRRRADSLIPREVSGKGKRAISAAVERDFG